MNNCKTALGNAYACKKFFNGKRFRNIIISTAGLEPGEYCLAITNMMTNTKSAKVYTFRIE